MIIQRMLPVLQVYVIPSFLETNWELNGNVYVVKWHLQAHSALCAMFHFPEHMIIHLLFW